MLKSPNAVAGPQRGGVHMCRQHSNQINTIQLFLGSEQVQKLLVPGQEMLGNSTASVQSWELGKAPVS